MKISKVAVFAAALLLLLAPAISQDDGAEEDDYEDEERAFLLVKKAVMDDVVVQGRNFTVQLTFYNAGSNSAKNIKIKEAPLPAELELVSGSLEGEIKALNPGKTATWTYSVVATSAGHFVAPPCSISYQASDDADSIQETVSTIFSAAILSASQKNLNTALKAGSYLSLGMLNSVNDWRNAGIAVTVVVFAYLANASYSKLSEASSDRRRQRAIEELEGKIR